MSAAPELGLVFIALAFRPDRGTLSLMDHLTHDPRARVQVTSTIQRGEHCDDHGVVAMVTAAA
jgi:hypothetical protein